MREERSYCGKCGKLSMERVHILGVAHNLPGWMCEGGECGHYVTDVGVTRAEIREREIEMMRGVPRGMLLPKGCVMR